MTNQTPVPAHEIEVKTPALQVSKGIVPAASAPPRPDLAGLRVTPLTRGPIYLVNPEGFLQLIPNPETYNNLFRDWNGVISMDTTTVAMGAALTDGTVLAKGDNAGAVYLVSNGQKRWITSPATMDKYYFNWNHIFVVPHVLVDFIPNGPSWS